MNKQPSWKDPITLWSHKTHFTKKKGPRHGPLLKGRRKNMDFGAPQMWVEFRTSYYGMCNHRHFTWPPLESISHL